jgi:hypothetical protein
VELTLNLQWVMLARMCAPRNKSFETAQMLLPELVTAGLQLQRTKLSTEVGQT